MKRTHHALLRKLAKYDLGVDVTNRDSIIRANTVGVKTLRVSYPAICMAVQLRLISEGKDGIYRLTDKGKEVAKEKWLDEKEEQLSFMSAEKESK